MRVTLIIQARSNSTRLKNKMFLMLDKYKVLEWVIFRLKKIKFVNNLVIATSNKVADKDIIKNAIKISKHVDYLLLDTGSFINKVELGGTGKVHDWNISKIIRNSVKIPIILAGGLNHRNVNKAIEKVMPFGVDVCSGVRTNDKLDLFKLKEFFNSLSLKIPSD